MIDSPQVYDYKPLYLQGCECLHVCVCAGDSAGG